MRESRFSKKTKSERTHIVRGIIYLAIFLVLAISLEISNQIELSHSSCNTPSADTAPPFYAPVYTFFLNWISDDSSSQVRVIAIDANLIDIQQNLCRGRSYLTDLITALAARDPAAIVIDKYFSQEACSSDPGDKQLTATLVKTIVSVGIPVIVGESTDLRSNETENCLVQEKQLCFGTAKKDSCARAANVHAGLLRLNVNKEQVPLYWSVLPSATATSTKPRESLSLVTASVVEPDLLRKSKFRSLLRDARQPYARIGPEPPSESSTALLCDSHVKTSFPLHCSSAEPRVDLRHKVVVIGAQSEADHWVVLGHKRWGFQLQAQYIDALLSGHYLRASGDEPLYLFVIFLIALDGVPFSFRLLYHRKHRVVPHFWRHDIRWVSIFSPVFAVLTAVWFFLTGYLPPLLMLSAVLLIFVSRLVFAGLEHSKHLILPEGRS